MEENQNTEKKSIRFLQGKKTDWNELAKDCVCFANSIGGFIFIGIEDRETLPPPNQKIKDRTLPEIIHKKIVERTTNVAIAVTLQTAKNNSEYILIQIFRSAQTIAATNDGKYYIRVSDSCRPVPPDEMARLAADKNAFIWEEQTNKKVSANQFDLNKKQSFLRAIRNSSRVSSFVKEKSEDEILEHYFFKKQIVNKQVVQLMDRAGKEFQLKQKEIISLGLIAQHETLSAIEISRLLNQSDEQGLRNWIGRLPDFELILSKGKTKGTLYFVNPEYLRKLNFKGKTTLKNIEDYRLEELIYKDIENYPGSAFGEIHQRIGKEINKHKIRRVLKSMVDSQRISCKGEKKGRKYFIE